MLWLGNIDSTRKKHYVTSSCPINSIKEFKSDVLSNNIQSLQTQTHTFETIDLLKQKILDLEQINLSLSNELNLYDPDNISVQFSQKNSIISELENRISKKDLKIEKIKLKIIDYEDLIDNIYASDKEAATKSEILSSSYSNKKSTQNSLFDTFLN